MQVRLLLVSALSVMCLAACETAPEPVPEPAPEPDPVIEVPEPPDPHAPRLDEWGGELPQAQPATEVNESGLGDIP